jgi:hypothetical protein
MADDRQKIGMQALSPAMRMHVMRMRQHIIPAYADVLKRMEPVRQAETSPGDTSPGDRSPALDISADPASSR